MVGGIRDAGQKPAGACGGLQGLRERKARPDLPQVGTVAIPDEMCGVPGQKWGQWARRLAGGEEQSMHWLTLFIGVLIGWLIEWLIDFLYWRRHYAVTLARLQGQLAVAQDDIEQLVAHVGQYQDVDTKIRELEGSLRRRTVEVEQLRAELALNRSRTTDARAGTSTGNLMPAVGGSSGAETDDDLGIIEGIGYRVASLLKEHGIRTFADLAAADVDRLRAILDASGARYRLVNPDTWPAQARLAAAGAWDQLQAPRSGSGPDLEGEYGEYNEHFG